ncbi:hypothetical protein [Duganella vulcania]|uniref:Uncharacterized protein n=1 Tax=Duganella vulcania TaxID=2692166 RepID=A0A845GGF0_9BURK|nr:hypothetical protein [Duganella vulcania]MYM92465.1 hypothetical protein [Duganella vulcania]
MNLKERKMLYRVHQALDSVPGAHIGGGTQSTTVIGVVNFGADIQQVRTSVLRALEALFDGAISKEERDELFEEYMGDAERFIARRKAVDWRSR